MALPKENKSEPDTITEPMQAMEQAAKPPAPVDPWAVLDRLTSALEGLRSAPATDTTSRLMETLSTALARVSETQIQAAQMVTDENRRAFRPENKVVPKISVFNRRGENLPNGSTGPIKQPLKCLMMLPWLAEWESLTREEVDLLNLLQPGTYIVKRIDNSKAKIDVTIDYKVDDVTPSRLVMTHETAFNNDYFRIMPDLAGWLRQMLKQHDPETARAASLILTDDEEAALIESGELTVSV